MVSQVTNYLRFKSNGRLFSREYFDGNKTKGRISTRCFKKTNHTKFSKKRAFLIPWYAHVRVRIRGQEMFVFSENLACFIFLKHPFWYSPFYLITDDLTNLLSIGWRLAIIISGFLTYITNQHKLFRKKIRN